MVPSALSPFIPFHFIMRSYDNWSAVGIILEQIQMIFISYLLMCTNVSHLRYCYLHCALHHRCSPRNICNPTFSYVEFRSYFSISFNFSLLHLISRRICHLSESIASSHKNQVTPTILHTNGDAWSVELIYILFFFSVGILDMIFIGWGWCSCLSSFFAFENQWCWMWWSYRGE